MNEPTDRDIYLWLKGDPLALRCVKPCPTCGNRPLPNPCSGACRGSGLVFRDSEDDAEGRERIRKAIVEWNILQPSQYVGSGMSPLEWWDSCKQVDSRCMAVMKHLRAYEAEPPALGDERVLKGLLRDWHIVKWTTSSGRIVFSARTRSRAWQDADTEAAALLAATRAAYMAAKGE